MLIQAGANINTVSRDGRTALLFAIQWGECPQYGLDPAIGLLIAHGANVNQRTRGCSPLYAAARFANARIVSELLHAGADVNLVEDESGMTVLMAAASHPCDITETDSAINLRQIETISLLIQAGANINAVSNAGVTALLNAISEVVYQVVGFFISHGADVNQRSALGTPLMQAIKIVDFNKVRLLVLAGAGTGNLPEDLFQKYILPIMTSLEELLTHHSSLITMAFVELKNSEQKENMFKNAAFRDPFHEWDVAHSIFPSYSERRRSAS